MYNVTIELEGISPLRMNKLSESAFSGTSQKMTEAEKMVDVENRSYKDDKGYYIPANALKAVIVAGGKKVKVGRGAASSLLKAIFHLKEQKIYLDKKLETEMYEGSCRIPPRTGAMVLKVWRMFPKWRVKFTAVIIDDRFPMEALKNAIIEAGMYYGLLDGRPDFGRFVLILIEKV